MSRQRTPGVRVPVSMRCDEAVWNQARSAARDMLRVDPGYTLAQLVEDAIRHELDRLAREHRGGVPWPATGDVPPLRRGPRAEP